MKLFRRSFTDYLKNPFVIIPGLILWIFTISFSLISVKLNYKLQNTFLLSSWLIIFSILTLLVISYFFSGLIGISFLSLKNKTRPKNFLKYSNKFWLRNFAVILIILAMFNITRYLAHNIGLIIGKAIELDVRIAAVLFFILYIGGILSFLIFFSYSSFYLVGYDYSILNAIKKSFRLVRKEYIETLIILTLYFAISQILEGIMPKIAFEVLNVAVIVPYLSLVMSRFVFERNKNDLRAK
ncbi:MAG: hypothetical protein Q7S27_06430 [Nanoarchaeota archaeon]|nr:hypothetical protein [Nanoarchaeota archaeon]